jgi:hypothetical protein
MTKAALAGGLCFCSGAHAQTQATSPLSCDRGFYKKLFPSLTVLDPSEL